MSIFDSILRALGLETSDPDVAQLAPLVIVKVLDSVALTGIDQGSTLTLQALVTQAGAPDSLALQAVTATYPDIVFGWAFTTVTAADFVTLVGRATEADPSYVAPRFDHFFEIVCAVDFDADGLAAALNAWTDVVEYADVQGEASDPLITGTGNPLFASGKQGYFAAAPAGITVAAAWAKGANGTGINVIDIEQGWFTAHEDLPASFSILNSAQNRVTSQAHGTAVVGIIAGQDNALGIVGAAPAAQVMASGYGDPADALTAPVNVQRVHDRIVGAAVLLPAGSVLLLEVQIQRRIAGKKTNLPVEAAPLAFEAIRLAMTVGLIVVEAAGNGKTDIGTWVMDTGPNRGKKTLARGTPDFRDSGAIMVASCTPAAPHTRFTSSNFGTRIDCYSWGDQMVTSGWQDTSPAATNIYWGVNLTNMVKGVPVVQFFGGTSGAAPVIVGCAVLIQHLTSLMKRKDGKTGLFDAPAMRSILALPSNGTPSTDPIGVMPDFLKLIPNVFTP
jgi:hypothetical protein